MAMVSRQYDERIFSMKKTILALGTLLPAEMDELEKHYDLIRLWKESDPETSIKNRKNDIVAILSSYAGMPVTRRILEALPNVSMIGHFGMGVDSIDLPAAKERQIEISNTPAILAPDTADIALSLMLAVSRRIVEADMYVRVGKWPNGAFPLATAMTIVRGWLHCWWCMPWAQDNLHVLSGTAGGAQTFDSTVIPVHSTQIQCFPAFQFVPESSMMACLPVASCIHIFVF